MERKRWRKDGGVEGAWEGSEMVWERFKGREGRKL